jgi:hypothetical protein
MAQLCCGYPEHSLVVMVGLGPAIHVFPFLLKKQDVDARA